MSNSIHSDRTSLLIGSKRFEKGPFFDFYHQEDVVYGVYAGRFYPVYMGKNNEDMYWALRQRSVLYDVPERPVQIEGPQVVEFLEKVFSRKIENLKVGRGRYAIACNEEGGLFMDGILFRLEENKFWYVQPDGALETWLMAHKTGFDVTITDPHSRVIQIQGPKSLDVIKGVTNGAVDENLKYYQSGFFEIAEQKVYVSRTGWTAELGYEIYTLGDQTDCKKLWDELISKGTPLGMEVDGILSMETRRIEAGIMDNMTDFDLSMNPFDAGMGALVDLDKPDFIGKDALIKISQNHQGKKIFGIICDDSFSYQAKLFDKSNTTIGYLSASVWSPTLKKNIAYGRFNESADWTQIEDISVENADGGKSPCSVVDLPFYDKQKDIPRGKNKKIPERS
jgi:glycine cleavage system aminomethyltransferase T